MTKLCPRGKAAAKRKFKVYPSAYANAYASKICAGKIKDPSGTKRKDWGPKKAKVGMAVTAGSQTGMGRLQKSGLKLNKGGGADFETSATRIKSYGKTKKVKTKKLKPSPFAKTKKFYGPDKKLMAEGPLPRLKRGKAIAIMIAVGKPKKANTGEFIERPRPRKRRKLKIYTKPDYEYIKKQKAYDILTDQYRPQRPLRPKKKSKGGDIIKKVASKLEKASKAHAGQAKTLRSIKVRGGGMAVQGMNFKGVY